MDRCRAIGKIHLATWIEDLGLRDLDAQMTEDPFMAASRLQACNLGRSDIKDPRSAPKGASTSTRLMVGFQQGDGNRLPGEQRSCGQTGNTTADHNHTGLAQALRDHRGMLATAMAFCGWTPA